MKKLYAAHLLLLALIVGCATDFNYMMSAGYSIAASVNDTATRRLNEKKISSAEHKRVTDSVAVAVGWLNDARRLRQEGNLPAAESSLGAARVQLSEQKKFLDDKGKP
jgi:soluble cytochrome b562